MQRIQQLLSIKHPIVQAPMLGVTTPAMVAAVTKSRALGSLSVGGLSPGRTRELIRATKALIQRPFAVNLFAHSPASEIDYQAIARMQDFLAEICREYQIPYIRQNPNDFRFYYYEDLIEVLLDEKIKVVSFTFGQLKAEVIDVFKQNGTRLIGTATSVAEAKALANAGIDIITVQGIEAGGIVVPFCPTNHCRRLDLMPCCPKWLMRLTYLYWLQAAYTMHVPYRLLLRWVLRACR